MECAICKTKDCYGGTDCVPELTEEARARLEDPGVLETMRVAAAIEAEGYGVKTRLEELIDFCGRTGVERVGMAFCIGLKEEAEVIARVLSAAGLDVSSACCKIGGISKDELGLARLHPERAHESTCNPVGQALVLKDAGTQLNVIVGLCMGHDIVFTNHSAVPVTTLVVKDRVLAHNPVGAIYCNYLRRRFGLPE